MTSYVSRCQRGSQAQGSCPQLGIITGGRGCWGRSSVGGGASDSLGNDEHQTLVPAQGLEGIGLRGTEGDNQMIEGEFNDSKS